MEGVEEANRAAVGSCTKLVASLARSGGDPFRATAAGSETDEAVSMFGKVVTILSNRVGHARARVKRGLPPLELDPSFLLEYHPPPPNNGFRAHGHGSCTPPLPVTTTTKTSRRHEINEQGVEYRGAMFLETPLLDLNGRTASATATASSSMVAMAGPLQQISTSKSPAAPAAANPPPPLPPAPCANQIEFHHQHQQQQGKRFQFEQQKAAAGGGGEKQQFHMEMAPRSKEPEVISFSFDSSACTSSASFFTSFSSQLISMSDAAGAAGAAPASRTKAAAGGGKKVEVDADGRCHCPKKKKPREKRVVRMPAISDKVADIPSDNYSWRKYGQKPIKGSPHPRGYYRCSSIKDCPARKHVERCRGDAGMLIVTYENDHNHAQPLDLSTLPAHSEA